MAEIPLPIFGGAILIIAMLYYFSSSPKEDTASRKSSPSPKFLSSAPVSVGGDGPKKKKKNKKPSSGSERAPSAPVPTSAVAAPSKAGPSKSEEVFEKIGMKEIIPTVASVGAEKKKKSKSSSKSAQAATASVGGGSTSKTSAAPVAKIDEAPAFYSKESIENFEYFEEVGLDPSEGWTEVEISKKGKKTSKMTAPSNFTSVSEMTARETVEEQIKAPIYVPPVTFIPAPTPVADVPVETLAPVQHSPPSQQIAQLAQPVAPAPPVPEVTRKEIKIDPKKIGFVIGPKGATLRSIEVATECEILMPKTERDSTSSATISVSGPASGVARVIFIIKPWNLIHVSEVLCSLLLFCSPYRP